MATPIGCEWHGDTSGLVEAIQGANLECGSCGRYFPHSMMHGYNRRMRFGQLGKYSDRPLQQHTGAPPESHIEKAGTCFSKYVDILPRQKRPDMVIEKEIQLNPGAVAEAFRGAASLNTAYDE